MKKPGFYFSVTIAVLAVFFIIFLAINKSGLFQKTEEVEDAYTKRLTPADANTFSVTDQIIQTAWGENLSTKIPLEENETVIAVLNYESMDGLNWEDQFVVFHLTGDSDPLHILLLGYEPSNRSYYRAWESPISATRPETISLYSQDLIGDRNNCVVITGMNSQDEHTMTVIRRVLGQDPQHRKIAELQVAGSISIQEVSRTVAYQQGISTGRSHNIVTYGPDPRSSNILDQVEIVYSFNTTSQLYQQSNVTRIPGSQIEQRRTREILSGAPGVFEDFIEGLWYFISPQGAMNTRQLLYFDPKGKEIIFFGEESQQVFRWQLSRPQRLGLYIRSQNLSITTLTRFIDIEMESLDRLRVRVTEDIRLRITVSTPWDGTYRRARTITIPNEIPQVNTSMDALFDSSWGRLQFHVNGEYAITSSGNIRRGHYVFFNIGENELLELRPEEGSNNRMVYKVENTAGIRILIPVRIGTAGIQELSEPPVTLTPVNQ